MLRSANHADVVDQLVRASADPNAIDTNGFAPLHHASLNPRQSTVEKLIANGELLPLCHGSVKFAMFGCRRQCKHGGASRMDVLAFVVVDQPSRVTVSSV